MKTFYFFITESGSGGSDIDDFGLRFSHNRILVNK